MKEIARRIALETKHILEVSIIEDLSYGPKDKKLSDYNLIS
jgi:hypothetical protein